jgi:hypothetical protein
MKTIIATILLLILMNVFCYAGDVYHPPEYYENIRMSRLIRLNGLPTETIISTMNTINGMDVKTYESSQPYDLPVMCEVLVQRNAIEAIPALKHLALQPAGNGEGSLCETVVSAAKSIVLLENDRFLFLTPSQKAQKILDLVGKYTTYITEPIFLGLKTEDNVYLTGYATVMNELVSKKEKEILPILKSNLNSANPIIRNFCRNSYPHSQQLEKSRFSGKTTTANKK